MASEMVERVARALFDDHWYDDPDLIWIAWDSASPTEQDAWRRSARAVLAAMKFPADAMTGTPRVAALVDHHDADVIWQAMIDAALQEEA